MGNWVAAMPNLEVRSTVRKTMLPLGSRTSKVHGKLAAGFKSGLVKHKARMWMVWLGW
jgi:hypothetical protein